MSIIHVNQIRSFLDNQFSDRIDMSDCSALNEEDWKQTFLTRSLAAYSLVMKCGLEPDVAAKYVTDGYGDNGIDVIYLDQDESLVYVGQSKWVSSGHRSPTRGDIQKFIKGFNDLTQPHFERFNAKLRAHEKWIRQALFDSNVRFNVMVIYTGQQELGDTQRQDLEDLKAEMNDPSETVLITVLRQREVHQAVVSQTSGAPIDLDVTRATNTQNRIEPRDFVSLDPEQDRIHTELSLMGKTYAYKTGDPDPDPDQGCNVVEATIALACADPDLSLAVQAKREISGLWEDIEREPYKRIFNGSVSGEKVWGAVQILRAVQQVLDKRLQDRNENDMGSMVAVHGNRFVLYRVFRNLPIDVLDNLSVDFEQWKQQAEGVAGWEVTSLIEAVDGRFPNSYLASLFKNLSKCKELDTYISNANANGRRRHAPRSG